MNDYLRNKLKEGRNTKGLKQSVVANMIGVKGNTLSNYENGVSEPDIDTFCALCDIYGLDPAEILGEAYGLNVQGTDFDIKPSEIEHIKKYRSLDPYGQETVNIVLEREASRVATLSKKDFRIKELEAINALPPAPRRIYTYLHKIAAAGVGFYFDDIPTDTIEAPYRENADFIVGVNGDSMEPTYSNGDLVYVEKCQIVEPGEIGIFIVNSECFIKEAGHDELISHNKKYKPIPGTEHIICVGRVLGKVNTD